MDGRESCCKHSCSQIMVIIKAKIVTTKSAFQIPVGTEFYQQPPTKLFSQVITAMTGSLVMYKS